MTPQREGKFRVLLRVPALAVTASLVAASTLRGVAAAAPYALLSCRRHVELWAPVWGWLASPSQSRHDPWRFLPCVWICVIAMAIMRTQGAARDQSGARRPARHWGAGVVQYFSAAGALAPPSRWRSPPAAGESSPGAWSPVEARVPPSQHGVWKVGAPFGWKGDKQVPHCV